MSAYNSTRSFFRILVAIGGLLLLGAAAIKPCGLTTKKPEPTGEPGAVDETGSEPAADSTGQDVQG